MEDPEKAVQKRQWSRTVCNGLTACSFLDLPFNQLPKPARDTDLKQLFADARQALVAEDLAGARALAGALTAFIASGIPASDR